MFWKLNELLTSSYATGRTIAIVNLKFVDRCKVASCSLLSQLFSIFKHLLPYLTDSDLLCILPILFEIAPVFRQNDEMKHGVKVWKEKLSIAALEMKLK